MKKILVIEDEKEIREKLIIILNAEGYDTLAVENGDKGVLAAFDYEPDMILCDIMMPGLDGFEVFSEVNYFSDRSITPFIFLTAKSDKDDIRKAMHLGAADYITKPFEINDLLKTVKIQLEKKEGFIQKIQDERLRLLAKLEHELLAKDQEIERLHKINLSSKNFIENQTQTIGEIIDKKSPKSNANILLIMSNLLIRLKFTTSIRKQFLSNVLEVNNLENAVKIAETHKIDYIILDSSAISDPLLLVRLIKRKAKLMHCPILIYAENIEKSTLSEFAKLGNIDFILNPFNPEKLNLKLSKYIS